MKIKYPGLKEYVKERLDNGLTKEDIYDEVKIKFKYGLNLRSFKRYIYETVLKNKNKNSVNKNLTNGRTLEVFKNTYDDSIIIPNKIEEAIKKYLVNENGEPAWMPDREFREVCDVIHSKWRRYAECYKHLQVKIGGDIIWGHPDIIDEMRKAVNR